MGIESKFSEKGKKGEFELAHFSIKDELKPENNKDLIDYLKRATDWIKNARNPYRNARLAY
jgi:hypothetical protein